MAFFHSKVEIVERSGFLSTVFPHIRPAGIIFSLGPQLHVLLLEIAKFHLYKSVLGAGIIRNAGIIRGRVLDEEIWHTT